MKTDVMIVGGGSAGMIAALTAKSVYPEKSVCLIKDIDDGVIFCALPYMMKTMPDPMHNQMGTEVLERAKVRVIIDTVKSFDPVARTGQLASGKVFSYERLVLATGTQPSTPSIPGVFKPGVFTIRKSMAAMNEFRRRVLSAKRIVIVGGGFIGVEFADELAGIRGPKVHVVEIMPTLLNTVFDDEFGKTISRSLSERGIKVHTGCRISSFDGEDSVKSVTLEGGEKIRADLVLLSIGAQPYSELARKAGLRIADDGSIWVDEYMRTSADGVFAVGDCALKRNFFTRKAVPVWLASAATAEARNVGTNLFGIRAQHRVSGTVSAFSTFIGGTSFASSGMTCRACEKEGFRYVTATAVAPDKYPETLPGAREMKVKLIFADRSGILLGGQISGGASVGELINMVALAIQKKVTVRELDMMQIATHPLLTPAPAAHPLMRAAHLALSKLRAPVNSISSTDASIAPEYPKRRPVLADRVQSAEKEVQK